MNCKKYHLIEPSYFDILEVPQHKSLASEFMVDPATKKTWWIRPPKIVKIKKMIMHVPTCFGIMHYHHQMWYLLSWMDYSFSSLSIILEPILAFLLELTADWVFWISNKMIVLINYEVVLYELNKRNKQSMKSFYLGKPYELNKHIELNKKW